MDPDPWADGEMSELERKLLEAARSDRVPDALGARMAERLGVQAAATAATAGLGTSLFAKAGLWGVLSIGGIALVGAIASWYATRSVEGIAPALRRGAISVPHAPERTAVPTDVMPPRSAGVMPAVEVAAAARRDDGVDDAALRAEIALLDRARNALRDGASARALRLLDQHRARFAHAQLAPEAAALRIEALVQRGAYDQADSMSRQFMASHPTHPLAERVADLTAARTTPRAR